MKRLLAVWLSALALFTANDAGAQGGDVPVVSRAEVWGAVTGVMTGPAGSLVSSYSPPLLLDGDFTSRGGQTLRAETAASLGLTGGVNVFPTRRVGVQVLFDRASSGLSGTNPAYTVALQYVSRPPPDNVPQIVNVDQSVAWPATSGSLTQMALAFNAVVRIGRADRLGATISGGPAFYRLSGKLQPLGFTTFRLGGHSVLFQDSARLALSFEPAHASGFDIGGEVSLAAGRHTAFIAGYRYFGGPDVAVAVMPAAVLNADEVIFEQSLADISSRLGPTPLRMSVASSRVFFGIRVAR